MLGKSTIADKALGNSLLPYCVTLWSNRACYCARRCFVPSENKVCLAVFDAVDARCESFMILLCQAAAGSSISLCITIHSCGLATPLMPNRCAEGKGPCCMDGTCVHICHTGQ